MSTIIYLIAVDNVPRYVGSCYERRFNARIFEHKTTTDWLKGIAESRISFFEIQKCDDDDRFLYEHFYWDLLVAEGFRLENKRDPYHAWPLVSNSEIAKIINETKRLNGTLSPSEFAILASHKKEVEERRIETKRAKGNIGNAGKANKGKRHSRIWIENNKVGQKLALAEKREIMAELGCSWIEAKRIRDERRRK